MLIAVCHFSEEARQIFFSDPSASRDTFYCVAVQPADKDGGSVVYLFSLFSRLVMRRCSASAFAPEPVAGDAAAVVFSSSAGRKSCRIDSWEEAAAQTAVSV